MDQIMEVMVKVRRKVMNSMVKLTDPGYYILKNKPISLSKEDTEYV